MYNDSRTSFFGSWHLCILRMALLYSFRESFRASVNRMKAGSVPLLFGRAAFPCGGSGHESGGKAQPREPITRAAVERAASADPHATYQQHLGRFAGGGSARTWPRASATVRLQIAFRLLTLIRLSVKN